ncbi:helix-turn-helix domain-containing protein [Leptospira sp. 96542]|nr:helix-turn-helix domain-containing protein [Leptospira sp. 96542]
MKISEWPVGLAEKDLIRAIVCFETQEKETNRLPFFADGFPGLIYFQSEAKVTVFAGIESKVMEPLFIYGQTIEPITIQFEAPFRMFMLQLFPSVIGSAFGIPIHELTNSCWSIPREEWGILQTLDSIENSCDIPETINSLVDLIVKRLANFKPDPILHQCIDLLVSHQGNYEIKDLTKLFGISERTLQRRFENYVGLTPKQFTNIIRFQSGLSKMKNSKKTQLTDIAYETGYFDQSHFIRHFKNFTKQKPFSFREKK